MLNSDEKLDLTVVIPLFNEEESITELLEWIYKAVKPMDIRFEAIVVDDGSKDESWTIIKKMTAVYPWL
ncbi:MAG TPA: glycosyltransferase, partial [Marinilabiliaceae bacterium]|nr:glycosyltransferase [Marinilabiliaceae bacterium]